MPGPRGSGACPRNAKGPQIRTFCEAAEGIRTLDLLHGKQDVWFPFASRFSCKRGCSQVRGLSCDSTAFTASSRGFGHRMGTRPGACVRQLCVSRFAQGGAELRARVDSELAVGVREVKLDGPGCHVERLGDLAVGRAFCRQFGDPPFAGRERLDALQCYAAWSRPCRAKLGLCSRGERCRGAEGRQFQRSTELLACLRASVGFSTGRRRARIRAKRGRFGRIRNLSAAEVPIADASLPLATYSARGPVRRLHHQPASRTQAP